MSTHRTTTRWSRTTPDFAYDTYGRDHALGLGPGAATTLEASAAVDFKGNPERTNPEELLVAALSSCHMLTFLAICAKKSLAVDRYEDDAEGHLEKGEDGKLWVTRVTLRPHVLFAPGVVVDAAALVKLHESAHRGCFIASSVKTEVTVEPQA